MNFKEMNSVWRSLLCATVLAGGVERTKASTLAEDDDISVPRMVLNTTETTLLEAFDLLCCHSERDIPFLYDDKGGVTAGQGVHLSHCMIAQGMPLYRLERRDGHVFKNTSETEVMCRELACDLTQIRKYPEFRLTPAGVYSADRSAQDLPNMFPWRDKEGKLHPKTVAVSKLFLLRSEDIQRLNYTAIERVMEQAKSLYPHFDALPRGIQLVVLDLIYNCGFHKYRHEFKKFSAAVSAFKSTPLQTLIPTLQAECTTKNNRRRNQMRLLCLESVLREDSSSSRKPRTIER